ncbi:MAG: hypothetical protein V4692_05515, partial [Bdellovibrionota bacterium]
RVTPEVTYHNVGVADLGYASKRFSVGAGALVESPDSPEIKDGFNHLKLSPMTMANVFAETRTFPSKSWGPRLRVGYLNTWGGESELIGPLATNGSVFGARTMFRQALSVSTQTLIYRSGSFGVEHGLRWIEEVSEQGTIVMTDVRFRIGDAWRVSISGDLLGSRKSGDQTDTFISRFRGNDRAAARVTYLF